jgi:hypothetical protein
MAYGDNAAEFSIDKIDTANGYNWFRPLNTLISVKKQGTPEVNFIKTLISGTYDTKLHDNGAQTLSDSEKAFMFPDNNYDN